MRILGVWAALAALAVGMVLASPQKTEAQYVPGPIIDIDVSANIVAPGTDVAIDISLETEEGDPIPGVQLTIIIVVGPPEASVGSREHTVVTDADGQAQGTLSVGNDPGIIVLAVEAPDGTRAQTIVTVVGEPGVPGEPDEPGEPDVPGGDGTIGGIEDYPDDTDDTGGTDVPGGTIGDTGDDKDHDDKDHDKDHHDRDHDDKDGRRHHDRRDIDHGRIGPSGGGIIPPSTGDAGMASGGSSIPLGAAVATGVAALAVLFGTTLVTVRRGR